MFKSRFILQFIFILVLGLTSFGTNAQSTLHQDTLKTKIGGQLKGMYISGGIWAGGGVIVGAMANAFDEYKDPDDFLRPVHVAVWATIPGSIMGLAIGSIAPKHRSDIRKSFQVGSGVILASKFRDNIHMDHNPIGLHLKVTSPEIWRWRYAVSYNQFSMWSEVNVDLQFVFDLSESANGYFLVGNNYLLRTGGDYSGSLLQDGGVNYGFGVNFPLSNKWNITGELRHTFAQSDHSWTVASFGIHYYL